MHKHRSLRIRACDLILGQASNGLVGSPVFARAAKTDHSIVVLLPRDNQDERPATALKELLKKKQEGKPIERPERPKPTNVVNLMEALRRSVEAGGAPTSSKPKPHTPARRAGNEKAEQPKRKKTRRTD